MISRKKDVAGTPDVVATEIADPGGRLSAPMPDTDPDPEAGDVEAGDVEAGDVEAGDVEAGDVEAGDVEPNGTDSPLEADAPEANESSDFPRDDDGLDEEEVVLEGARLRQVLEALFFSSADPLTVRKIRRLLPEATLAEVKEQLLALEADLITHGRGHILVEENGGYRFLTRTDLAPFVARLRGTRKRIRLSKAAFETLAVVAYRQPMRRSDLDVIRGVQSGAIIKNLMEWNLVQIVGRDESLGRPLLYGTTEEFLEQFGIPALDQLPDPEQLCELGEELAADVLPPDGAQTETLVADVEPAETELAETELAETELAETELADAELADAEPDENGPVADTDSDELDEDLADDEFSVGLAADEQAEDLALDDEEAWSEE